MQIDSSRTSPAQSPGRQGWRVDRVVWHHTGGGSVAGAINWVTRPGADAGYHYLVDEQGRIFRVTPEENTSWHSGNWTMNLRSIGICHPVDGGPDATRQASVALTRDICWRFGIPADPGHILPHRAVIATQCPGNLPVNEWIVQVAQGQGVAPGPSLVKEDALRYVSCVRPQDGQLEEYWLQNDGTVVRTVVDQGFREQPPGQFQTLGACGYNPNNASGNPFIRGLGMDGHVWLAWWDGQTTRQWIVGRVA